MGVLTASGGACDLIADASSAQGIEIPDFSPATEEAIGAFMPPFGNPHNPLDVTAYGSLANIRQQDARSPPSTARSTSRPTTPTWTSSSSPSTLPEARPPDEAMAATDRGAAQLAGRPHCVRPHPGRPDLDHLLRHQQLRPGPAGQRGLTVLGGLDLAVSAIGHSLRWQENRGRVRARRSAPRPPPPQRPTVRPGPWSEQHHGSC